MAVDCRSGLLDRLAEVGIAEVGLDHEVHGAVEQFAEVRVEAVVDANVGGVGLGQERDEEVEVAGLEVEVSARGGAEQVEALDLVLAAEVGDRFGLVGDQRNHAHDIVPCGCATLPA